MFEAAFRCWQLMYKKEDGERRAGIV